MAKDTLPSTEDSDRDDSPNRYECAECGHRTEAISQPGDCPECGGHMEKMSESSDT